MSEKKGETFKIFRKKGTDLIAISHHDNTKIDIIYSYEVAEFLNIIKILKDLIGEDVTIEIIDDDGLHLKITFVYDKGDS